MTDRIDYNKALDTPGLLPPLSAGAHAGPEQGACIMEYVSLLAGEDWSDSPACTHPVLAAVARQVNDRLGDSQRQALLPLLPRLMGTAASDETVGLRLAVFSARYVLHLVQEQDRAVCERAIAAAEAVADGTGSESDAADAAADAAHAADAAADAAYAAADAAYAAAYAAAAYAADAAADAAGAAADAGFLTALIDEFDRITGRTEVAPLTTDDLATLGVVR